MQLDIFALAFALEKLKGFAVIILVFASLCFEVGSERYDSPGGVLYYETASIPVAPVILTSQLFEGVSIVPDPWSLMLADGMAGNDRTIALSVKVTSHNCLSTAGREWIEALLVGLLSAVSSMALMYAAGARLVWF